MSGPIPCLVRTLVSTAGGDGGNAKQFELSMRRSTFTFVYSFYNIVIARQRLFSSALRECYFARYHVPEFV